MTERIGIYPGTFDPITVGHMDIVSRALKVVDKLVIAVALDTAKQPVFDNEMRAALIRETLDSSMSADDIARIEVSTFSGLLVSFAEEKDATVLIRGLRAVSDFEYEFQMACMNNHLAPEIETVFLTASESTHFISSRFVKQIASLGGDVSQFVSPSVLKQLKAHYESKAA